MHKLHIRTIRIQSSKQQRRKQHGNRNNININKNCKINGEIKADYITFEVDESYVPKIFKTFRLDTLVILDFFRDQLDRNGEVETLILKIQNF